MTGRLKLPILVLFIMLSFGCIAGIESGTDGDGDGGGGGDGDGGGGGGGNIGTLLNISGCTILRLDGTELSLTDTPLPRMMSARCNLTTAVTEASDREAFENNVGISDANGNFVTGTFTWATDYSSVTFTPAAKFAYGMTYTVSATASAPASVDAQKAAAGELQFTIGDKGDVNGDGYPDLIVGAHQAGGSNKGQAYLFYGSATGIASTSAPATDADAYFTGTTSADNLGQYVSIEGDYNADGYSDVVVGADMADAGGANRGQAYVFFGSTSLLGSTALSSANVTISGSSDNYFAGYAASAGDINGDGYDDLVVGAYGADRGTMDRGQASIFLGGPNFTGSKTTSEADTDISGDEDYSFLGHAVASGDINDDGYDDVAVGAWGATHGILYIFFGSQSGITNRDLFTESADVTITGASSLDAFAKNGLAMNGDINNDGIVDLAVGAPTAAVGPSRLGTEYIFFGSTSFAATSYSNANVTITGQGVAGGDKLGSSASMAGDLNNDGIDDLIVGDPNYDSVSTNYYGRVYIFLGSSTLSGTKAASTANAIITGTVTTSTGAYGIITGDLSGDGRADVVVGAPDTNSDRGQVYIFTDIINDCVNNCTAPTTADVTLTGASADDRLSVVY